MRLNNTFKNEFGQTEGTAFFPYFNKEITVICREGVSSEYAERCLKYLEEMDDILMLQICKYAELFLKDKVENTSIGESDDVEAFRYDDLLDLLKYISFETLYIEEPPKSLADSSEIYVLNLTGGCDWWEDEGLQCLVRGGEVVYLGYFDDLSVWGDYSEMYIGNYVLYETYRKRLQTYKENMIKKVEDELTREQRFFIHWNEKGYLIRNKVMDFVQEILVKENISYKEAVITLENTYLYQMMNEYPELLEERVEFLWECYQVEKEADAGELMRYICENCEWELL